MKRKSTFGFTLLELMIVVAIIGVLASVAIPQFQKFIRRSKTTEAFLNIRKIYDGELAYYNEEHVDKKGGTLSKTFVQAFCQPNSPPGVQKQLGNFEKDNWPLIHFIPDGPVQYVYTVDTLHGTAPNICSSWNVPGYGWQPPANTIDGFLVRANGDLDGDGTYSEFARIALVNPGSDQPEGFGGIFTYNETE